MHLLVDEGRIQRREGVRRVVAQPQRRAMPVIAPQMPWEGYSLGLFNSLFHDEQEGLFKLWYRVHDPACGTQRFCYATSLDGLEWVKPELGLVAREGSTANNIVPFDAKDAGDSMLGSVVKDPRDPNPARRYKALGFQHTPHGTGVCVGYSRDGLAWQGSRRNPVLSTHLVTDTDLLHGWDDERGVWVGWFRPRTVPKKRFLARSVSRDFEHWTLPEMILASDDDDPPGTEFYGLNSAPAGEGWMGLVWVYHNTPDDQTMDVQLAWSPDGVRWQRVSRAPFLTRGVPGSGEEGMVHPGAVLNVGDEVRCYYVASNRLHGTPEKPEPDWGEPLPGGGVARSDIRVATLGRDRWVGLEAAGEGLVETRYLTVHQDTLTVNADASGGSLRVELLDHEAKPVAGYGREDCLPLTTDAVRHTVRWRGGESFGALLGTPDRAGVPGRVLRLRFWLEQATLYGYDVGQAP